MISIIISALLSACSPQDSTIAPKQDSYRYAYIEPQLDSIAIDSNGTFKSVATFPVGIATGSWLQRKSPKGFKQLENQFSSKTVYAYMNIEVSRGKYNFGESDYWVKWAETHPVRLHGHCLVYHQAAPEWLLSFKGSTTEFEQIIKDHIQTVVSRYKGRIKSWDVINEAFSATTGGVAGTPFRKLYDSDASYLEFVKRCFKWAHEADPDALLFYNDGNLENVPSKLNSVVQFANNLKANGIPINGIGSQTHISIDTPNSEISNLLQRLVSTGLLVHISELDMRINPDKIPDLVFTNQLYKAQGMKLQTVAKLYKQLVPKHQQHGITFWDISDADSWIVVQMQRHDAPCLFDGSFNKKMAFYGFLQGLK
ncbi:hypothetical protein GCM10028818_42820 [Spirosoma horti]